MKKLFSLLTLALLTMSAWAESTVTIDFSAQEYENGEEVSTLTVGDVTVDLSKGTNTSNGPKYYTTGTGVRLYVGNTLTLTSAGDNITKAVFTFSDNGYTFGSNTTANTGVYSESSATGTWLGNNASFTVSPARTCRLQKIEVTLGGEVIEAVLAPSLPESRKFQDNYTVQITNNEVGATVKYSIDEQATWNTYSAPFTINTTSTVYAKAVKGNVESTIVNATYTKLEGVDGSIAFLPADFDAVSSEPWEITKDNVTLACDTGSIDYSLFRIFKGRTLSFTSSDADIIKIEFTCTAKGTTKYGPGCFAEQTGYTYETDGYIGTWVGKAKTVSFTAATNQVRATQIVVTLDDGSTVVVAAPILPESQNFDDTFTVTITAEEGAAIKYNFDNGETWNDYTAPFTINETKDVYAKAINNGVTSPVAHAKYTKNEPATGITTLAQANALPNDSVFTFEGTGVVVTYQTANKQYTFLRDATGYGNFYQADTTNMNNMPALQNGKVLNPNWTATKATFRNLPEFKNASNVSASTNTDAELAAPIEISALADSMINAYVTVKNIKKFAVTNRNITITMADGTTMAGFNQFNISLTDLPTTEGNYTAIGIVGKYNNNRQFWLISWEGQGTPEPEPTEVGDLATANAVDDGIKITYLNDVAATYQHGNYLFIRDENGKSGLIYGAVGATFETGDVLGADWTATKTTYHGAPQFINPNGVTNSGNTWTVEPYERETLTADNVHEYVIVKGQTITACTDTTNQYMAKTFYNGDGMVLFNQFGVDMSGIEEGKTYDVVGIANLRDGEVQMYIISVTEATAAGLRGDVDNSGIVDISDATALINYLLYGNSDGLNMDNANCDLTGGIDITDATTLINYLLYGSW